jgi:ATP-dependent protease ClpP protease subunit
MGTQPAPVNETDSYVVWAGPINQDNVQKFFQGLANVAAGGTQHIHLMLHSMGGYVSDGIALYNFFRALPTELTVYNAGACYSAAVLAYLGANKRRTSASAAFML